MDSFSQEWPRGLPFLLLEPQGLNIVKLVMWRTNQIQLTFNEETASELDLGWSRFLTQSSWPAHIRMSCLPRQARDRSADQLRDRVKPKWLLWSFATWRSQPYTRLAIIWGQCFENLPCWWWSSLWSPTKGSNPSPWMRLWIDVPQAGGVIRCQAGSFSSRTWFMTIIGAHTHITASGLHQGMKETRL